MNACPLTLIDAGQIRVLRNMDCLDGYDENRLITYLCNPVRLAVSPPQIDLTAKRIMTSKLSQMLLIPLLFCLRIFSHTYCSARSRSYASSVTHIIHGSLLQNQVKQTWSYTDNRQLRTGHMCIDAGDAKPGTIVQPKPCEEKSTQKWDLIVEYAIWNASASIVLAGTSLCLTPPSPYGTDIASVTLQKCVKPSCRQAWLVNAWRGSAAKVSVERPLYSLYVPVTPLYRVFFVEGRRP